MVNFNPTGGRVCQTAFIDDNDFIDEKDLAIPGQYEVYDASVNADNTPQPFVSSKLIEKDAERENLINQKYFRIISSMEYREDPVAFVQEMIRVRGYKKNDKWMTPEDDLIKRLRQDLGI